jgi:DNA-directed RNA polymerase
VGASYIGSKLSFQERSSWVDQNVDLLAAVAADPAGTYKVWERADDPFLFLALALEWNAVVVEKTQPLWHVPLQFDATCSGLQLLSGCLCDPVGLFHANGTSTEATDGPNDAYRAVVRSARDLALAHPETASLAQYLNDRSLGKASLLVAVYGGSHLTRKERVLEAFQRDGLYPGQLSTQQISTITTLLQRASQSVFPKAFEALSWLKRLGKAAIASGSHEFSFSTPACDRICLRELERKTKVINTHLLGRVSVAVDFKETTINPGRMVSALPPSFVHALDASLLKVAFQGWQRPLATIHDCIAVLPTDADAAMHEVRRAFVEVTAGDPLARLADDLGIPASLLPRLQLGDADVSCALTSPYLFN